MNPEHAEGFFDAPLRPADPPPIEPPRAELADPPRAAQPHARGLNGLPPAAAGWDRARLNREVRYAWSDARMGRGWMFYGAMPTHMPHEFGEALRTFWELMFFRSRWLISYKRELSQLVDQERYADAFLLALQYDMQRQTRREEVQAHEQEQEREEQRRSARRQGDAEREAAELDRRDEELIRLQHLAGVVEERRREWRSDGGPIELEDQPPHTG